MISFFRRRRRKNDQEKEYNTRVLRNGKILLEKLITSGNDKRNPIRGFSFEEIKIATNNFDPSQVIADGGPEVYKGYFQNRPISVVWHGNRGEKYCYNDIVFASQMSHKNVLKLIGCCLETEIPTLVFESAEPATLAERIHNHSRPNFEPLLLAHRFKIAMEIANAVAYLHLGFRRPIVFKDINPSHVLLDENVAKLYDFSQSETIPEGETHIKGSGLMAMIGFVAPEYYMTLDCNEKCDVYSFGMLLLELLLGKAINSLAISAGDGGWFLQGYVKKHIENNRFDEIVDPIIVEDKSCPGKEQQLQAFAQLICECINESPEDRPAIMDVAKQLRKMYLTVV